MIRELSNREIDEIMEIWLESNIEAHNFIPKEYWEINYDIVKETYIPRSKTYISVSGNVIEGFVSVINNSYIGALFVRTNLKRKGIGSKLMEHVQNKYKALILGVYEKNEDAISFYKNMGFTKIGKELNSETEEVEIVMGWNK